MDARKRYPGQVSNKYLTDGNAARKVTEYLEQPEVEVRERAASRKAKELKPHISTDIGLGWMILLVAAIAITLYTCFGYLKVQADIVVANKNISRLESELKDMRTRNEAAYNSVVSAVDFDEVYRVAVGELGMVFPNKNKVITYKVDAGGYVRQYADIPEAERMNALRELLPFEELTE